MSGAAHSPSATTFRSSPVSSFFHELQHAVVLALVEPEPVSVGAEVELEVIVPVLEPLHGLAAVRAFPCGGRGTKDQAAFLVVAEVERLVLELL